jgi:hypothetical protein
MKARKDITVTVSILWCLIYTALNCSSQTKHSYEIAYKVKSFLGFCLSPG